MRAIVNGHTYVLPSVAGSQDQTLRFIHKVPIAEGSKELRTIEDGTTTENVIACLLDRLRYLNRVNPCRDNSIAITKLEDALFRMERRTKDRTERGVEGTASL